MKLTGLRQRLAWALVATGGATALLLGGLLWFSEEQIESASLRRLMEGELQLLAGARHPTHPQQLFYRPSRGLPPPAEWQMFPSGSFRRVQIDGHPYQLLVLDARPGDRIYLAQSLGAAQKRESWLLLAVLGGVALSALMAFAASRPLSRLALQPLQMLRERLRALRPEHSGQRLQATPETPELDVIIQALNDYMQALDRMVAREKAFAGAAAHELQTPLTVIAGAAELLETEHADEPALGRIRRASAQASEMLDLLLALSQTREAPPARVLRLSEELPRLAAQCTPRADVNIQWELPEEASLEAPPSALALVFLNLLRNAQRAARSLVRVQLNGKTLVITDDGDGIAPELLPKLFEPGTSGSGGSGLGLYIARAVAERQGWSLTLANSAQGGAVATLRWP